MTHPHAGFFGLDISSWPCWPLLQGDGWPERFSVRPRQHRSRPPSSHNRAYRASAKKWISPAMIILSVLALTTVRRHRLCAIGRRDFGRLDLFAHVVADRLFALGVVTGRGRRREFWLGATLLGAGFMFLVFNRPIAYDPDYPRVYLPTVEFLEALRPRYAAARGKVVQQPHKRRRHDRSHRQGTG